MFLDVGEHPAKLYCGRCRLIRDRDRKKVTKIKVCGICGKELIVTHASRKYHKECVINKQRERALEYKRDKK